jgi:hypothetical protein
MLMSFGPFLGAKLIDIFAETSLEHKLLACDL